MTSHGYNRPADKLNSNTEVDFDPEAHTHSAVQSFINVTKRNKKKHKNEKRGSKKRYRIYE